MCGSPRAILLSSYPPCCVRARAVPVTGEASGFLPRHGFRSVKDVFRDIPPPFCPVFRGKYGCGLHCSVPSCRPFGGCNAAELGASALDPPHQMSGGRRYGRTPRERDAEKCWAEHGSGASCAEATGCGTWVEAPGKTWNMTKNKYVYQRQRSIAAVRLLEDNRSCSQHISVGIRHGDFITTFVCYASFRAFRLWQPDNSRMESLCTLLLYSRPQ